MARRTVQLRSQFWLRDGETSLAVCYRLRMVQLTVSIADERFEALQKAAAARGVSVDEVVDRALSKAGIGDDAEFDRIIAVARQNAGLSDEDAMALALEEVRQHRTERRRAANGD